MRSPATPEFLHLQEAVAGRFSLERELGRGGMAIVFLARDVALDRHVAIKLLPEWRAADADLRERFLREARTAAKLSHPNIVPIHLVETRGDLVYFVMSYVDGETLGQRVRRAGPLPASQVTRLVQEVAWALAYAHGRGVVHRDIKPDNILIDRDSGRAMVTDFGIASVTGAGTSSQQGEIVGTAHYMSPEQAIGRPVDGRSDLFSLGITAFYALSGSLPFDGPHVPAIVARIVNDPAPSVADARPGLPAALARAIDRCLEKRPDARFDSGEELADALSTAVVPKEVAPQLRYFLKTFQALDPSLAYLVLAIGILPGVWDAMWSKDHATVLVLFYLTFAPFLTGVAMIAFAARHVLKAGLGVDDVRRAFEREVLARREEAESVSLGAVINIDRVERRRRRWLSAGWLGVGGAIATIVAGRIVGLPRGPVIGTAVLFGALGALAHLGAFSLGRYLQERAAGAPPRSVGVGFSERVLKTRFANWLFRAAGIGLDVRAQNAPPPREPTEVLIASEVTQLFDRLSPSLQDRFADVPGVMRRLEAEADRLRRRHAALASISAAPVGEAARVAERLETAVAALETVRLDLLRLDAGLAAPGDLTANLVRARAIGDAVDAELRAAPPGDVTSFSRGRPIVRGQTPSES